MTKQIIYIVGPTGTGKTNLALKLHTKIPSILVSADSRQVYRGMNIVPGKDHPQNTLIHGLDLVGPSANISVSTWYDAVVPVIKQAFEEGKTPIVVGGTGFYIKAITSGIATISAPINENLRQELATLSLEELQIRLQSVAPNRYSSMNHSDQRNPRRLVRAIEIALSPAPPNSDHLPLNSNSLVHHLYGLRYPTLEEQKGAILSRVVARLAAGALTETQQIQAVASPQALSSLGYRHLIAHLKGKIGQQEMIDSWVSAELSYVKRQLTYFRKLDVIWYDRTVVSDEEIIYDILQS